MILAVLDDLLFASRLRTTAAAIGGEIVIARTADDAVAQARRSRPARVILDLNSPSVDAPALIRRFRAEPALAALRLVGFAAHVRTEAIAAAREAGVDEVLARSAFISRLPDLLAP
jgi:CheY-like chemotaxis protein